MAYTVDTKDFDRAARDLETFRAKAIPFAAKDALNATAFEARRMWGDEIRATFTTRNQYTARTALRVEKAQGRTLSTMQSKTGSIAEYMDEQEQGGTVSGPIPAPAAAGQQPGGTRTRPVRKTNRIKALEASRSRTGKSRKQRNAIALAQARRRGLKHVVLDRPAGGVGLFRLMGGKRKIKTRLVWALGRGPSRLSANPTLGPTLTKLQPKLGRIWKDAVVGQLRRHRVLGY